MSHGGGGSDRWLVSYADFITLLMVLFVVLYSMSQVDVQKYKQLADGLKVAFSGESSSSVIDPQIDLGGSLNEDEQAAPIIIPGIPQASMDTVEVAGQLTNMLSSTSLGEMVSVQNNLEGVLISVSEKLLFVPGTAELQPSSYQILDTVVQMINRLDNEIKVIGHTDNTPPSDARYSSNWELSLARAMTIVTYFQNSGISPKRLIPAGRGEYHPIFPNDTPEHQTLNSRADIIVIYPIENEVIEINIFDDQNNVNTEMNDQPSENTGEDH